MAHLDWYHTHRDDIVTPTRDDARSFVRRVASPESQTRTRNESRYVAKSNVCSTCHVAMPIGAPHECW